MTDDGRDMLRGNHVAEVARLLPGYVARIDWPVARLRQERTVALRALLATAVERSPWHRGRLGGLDIAALSEGDIVDLPMMTKTDLMDNFDAIVTDPRLTRRLCEDHLDQHPGDHLLDEFQIVASGGSSGLRGVLAYGWEAWATCYAPNIRFQTRDWSLDPSLAQVRRVIAVVAASSPTHISAALSKTFTTGSREASVLRQPAARGDRRRAQRAATNGTHGLQLLSSTPGDGSPRRPPAQHPATHRRHLRTTPARNAPRRPADLGRTDRQRLRHVRGCVFSGFCGHSIHLPDDLIIFEPVDVDGHPVGGGELSRRVLITNLYNHAQPLIRYEVTDQITLAAVGLAQLKHCVHGTSGAPEIRTRRSLVPGLRCPPLNTGEVCGTVVDGRSIVVTLRSDPSSSRECAVRTVAGLAGAGAGVSGRQTVADHQQVHGSTQATTTRTHQVAGQYGCRNRKPTAS